MGQWVLVPSSKIWKTLQECISDPELSQSSLWRISNVWLLFWPAAKLTSCLKDFRITLSIHCIFWYCNKKRLIKIIFFKNCIDWILGLLLVQCMPCFSKPFQKGVFLGWFMDVEGDVNNCVVPSLGCVIPGTGCLCVLTRQIMTGAVQWQAVIKTGRHGGWPLHPACQLIALCKPGEP